MEVDEEAIQKEHKIEDFSFEKSKVVKIKLMK